MVYYPPSSPEVGSTGKLSRFTQKRQMEVVFKTILESLKDQDRSLLELVFVYRWEFSIRLSMQTHISLVPPVINERARNARVFVREGCRNLIQRHKRGLEGCACCTNATFCLPSHGIFFPLMRVKKQKVVMPNVAADVSVRPSVQEYQGSLGVPRQPKGVPRQPKGVPRQPRESQGNPVGEGECYYFLAGNCMTFLAFEKEFF